MMIMATVMKCIIEAQMSGNPWGKIILLNKRNNLVQLKCV